MKLRMNGERIKTEMWRRGWSTGDLARESKLSDQTVRNAIAGHVVSPHTRLAIDEAFRNNPAPELDETLVEGAA